jgi:hypothetical protein
MSKALKVNESISRIVTDVKPYDRETTISEIETIDFSEGLIIPSSWNRHVFRENGRADLVGITLLAEIVGWYKRLSNQRNFSKLPKNIPALKTCVQDFIDMFGYSPHQTVRAFDRLVSNGFIFREYDEPNKRRGKMNLTATFSVMPDVDVIKKITYERN